MLNVIRGEWYKTRHRSYLYISIGICCLLALGLVLIFYLNSSGEGRVRYEDVGRLLLAMLSFGVYFSLIPCDIVFSEEYKHQTMKNSVSHGCSRTSLYMGKLTVTIAVAMFGIGMIVCVLMGSAYLILGVEDAALAGEITARIWVSLAGAFPLWTGALCVINMMSFYCKNSTMMSFTFVGMFMATSLLMVLLGSYVSPFFFAVRDWMIMPQFDALQNTERITGPVLARCYIVGLGYAAVSTAVGLLLFHGREVK